MDKKSQPGNLFGADFGLASYRADPEIGPVSVTDKGKRKVTPYSWCCSARFGICAEVKVFTHEGEKEMMWTLFPAFQRTLRGVHFLFTP